MSFDPLESSFLNSIAADPSDAGVQLVYADWLEEQGRPEQSELIRLSATAEAGESGVLGGDLAIDSRWCPAGTFTMGSPEDEEDRKDNETQVEVTLTRGFWMGRTTVTQGQFVSVMGTRPWVGKQYVEEGSNHPATYVDWDDATELCRKLTEQEHRAERLPAGWSYRLPTEAEWEYACRAETDSAYSFGDDAAKLGEYGWFRDNANDVGEEYAHEVGLKKPNAWGLCDLHGNVWEWCSDWFAEELRGGRDPRGPTEGSYRVPRGGCWRNLAKYCRSASRAWFAPSDRYSDLGFRLAMSPSGK